MFFATLLYSELPNVFGNFFPDFQNFFEFFKLQVLGSSLSLKLSLR